MENQFKNMADLFNNPMFQQGANEYFKLMQQQGLESAKKFWGSSTSASVFPDSQQVLDQMAEFSKMMGFVPMGKYDELQKEQDKLRAENQLLRDTISELQKTFASENSIKAQEAWQSVVDKQLEMSREVTQSFFEALKQTPK